MIDIQPVLGDELIKLAQLPEVEYTFNNDFTKQWVQCPEFPQIHVHISNLIVYAKIGEALYRAKAAPGTSRAFLLEVLRVHGLQG